MELWDNGYLNASVPTDLIEDGRLQLNASGKPTLNGYVFDAIVFLNPDYAQKKTTTFIQNFVAKGGKLLIEGKGNYDFNGHDNSAAWKNIAAKAVANSYSLENVAKLGIQKNELRDGVNNEPGAFTFTSIESLKNNTPATFSFEYAGNTFTGTYKGLAAIKVDAKGNLMKLAATGFGAIQKNGREILSLSSGADIFLSTEKGKMNTTIADPSKSVKLVYKN